MYEVTESHEQAPGRRRVMACSVAGSGQAALLTTVWGFQ